jgi:hypothetical protein
MFGGLFAAMPAFDLMFLSQSKNKSNTNREVLRRKDASG